MWSETRYLVRSLRLPPTGQYTKAPYEVTSSSFITWIALNWTPLKLLVNLLLSQFLLSFLAVLIIVNAFNSCTKIRPLQPFKCEKCGRTYKVNDSLKKHLKYESGLDPSFPCNQCNYRAERKHTLKSISPTFMLAPIFPSLHPVIQGVLINPKN